MEQAKGRNWEITNQNKWLVPVDDVYYLADRWTSMGFHKILDLGCGLGRHSIFFAQHGFEVYALDISSYAIDYLNQWSERESLHINTQIGDIKALPYEDNFFDCILAYHSLSHADSIQIKQVVSEFTRVLKPEGEIYASLCSKSSWDYCESGYPKLDENTVINKMEGPEYDIPHYYADREDILELFSAYDIDRIRHIDYCYKNHQKWDGKFYYINAKKNKTLTE